MKYLLEILFLLLLGCSSVSKVDSNRYIATCHYLMSDESCAKDAAEACPDSFEIKSSENTWNFFQGAKKNVVIACKKSNNRNLLVKLKEQGFRLIKDGGKILAEKESKTFLVSDSKYLCSLAKIDLQKAKDKGFELENSNGESFLSNGTRKILLSNDHNYACKRI